MLNRSGPDMQYCSHWAPRRPQRQVGVEPLKQRRVWTDQDPTSNSVIEWICFSSLLARTAATIRAQADLNCQRHLVVAMRTALCHYLCFRHG